MRPAGPLVEEKLESVDAVGYDVQAARADGAKWNTTLDWVARMVDDGRDRCVEALRVELDPLKHQQFLREQHVGTTGHNDLPVARRDSRHSQTMHRSKWNYPHLATECQQVTASTITCQWSG